MQPLTPLTIAYTLKDTDLEAMAASMRVELSPLRMNAAAGWQLVGVAALFGVVLWAGLRLDMPQWLLAINGLLMAFVIAVLLLYPLALIIQALLRVLLNRQRRAGERHVQAFARLVGTQIRWAFDDSGFRVESVLASRAVAWSDVRRVRVDANFWLLELEAASLLLPAALMQAEAEALIRARCRVTDQSAT